MVEIEKRTKRQQTAHEKKVEKVALALRKFLEDRGLWSGCKMFYNGKKIWRKSGYFEADTGDESADGDPLLYMEYANPDTVCINFEESEIYNELNYGSYNPDTKKYSWKTTDALHSFLGSLGWYYELGHSWNLSLYACDK